MTHDRNEHGRSWNGELRDALTCRLNQACDKAADKAALAIGERFRPLDPGHRLPGIFVTGGIKFKNDIKAVIAAKHTHNLLALLRGLPKHHGATARALEQGDVDAESSESSFKQLTTEAKHNTARIRVGCDHCPNMPETYSKAKTDKHRNILPQSSTCVVQETPNASTALT